MSGKHEKKKSGSRIIGYYYEGTFDESAMERVLNAAVKAEIVTQFDTGRGSIVWFNGYPGNKLREVRDKVEAVLRDSGHSFKQLSYADLYSHSSK